MEVSKIMEFKIKSLELADRHSPTLPDLLSNAEKIYQYIVK
jgi:hypothetical protein